MKSLLALSAAALLVSTGLSFAQEGGPGGDRRNRFNPEEFRKMMNDRLKEAMKATDEEWAAISPLIDKVRDKQMAGRGSFMGRGGPGGPGGDRPSGDRPPGGDRGSRGPGDRGSSPEAQALRDTLAKPDASADEINAKLAALREQRKRAEAELEATRAELKAVLTARQEAVLVGIGILE